MKKTTLLLLIISCFSKGIYLYFREKVFLLYYCGFSIGKLLGFFKLFFGKRLVKRDII